MKKRTKIMGILLLLLIAGNGALYAQRGMRSMMDSTRLNRMRPGMDVRQDRNMDRSADSLIMRDMRRGISPFANRGQMNRMRNIRPGQEFNMRRGMARMPMNRMRWNQMGPGRRGNATIPNLTEEQKKEISDLRQKQQDEMKILRDDLSAKMKSLTETHRNALQDLLTDEQKEVINARSGKTVPVPEK